VGQFLETCVFIDGHALIVELIGIYPKLCRQIFKFTTLAAGEAFEAFLAY
jgi:hypothetical protein